MKNNKTKILVILLVIVLIIVALAATVVGMVYTGKLALTDKQKLAKGLNDIKVRLSSESTQEDSFMQEYEKMYTTPFEAQTTITGKVNTLDIEGAENDQTATAVLDEIKEMVSEAKITNTVQADLKNNVVVENLKLEVGDVVEEISLDFEYNKDRIALRSKELNEKYLTFTKDGVESNTQYEDFVEIFEMFETLCEKTDTTQLTFTDAEKLHFQENYTGIFNKYLTDDMITSEKAIIDVDGQTTNCSAVTVTFNKRHIQEILGEYLKIFESDTTGRNILLSKLTYFSEEVTDEDLLDMAQDFRTELEELPEDAKIALTVFCDNFKTYEFELEMYAEEESSKINVVLGTDVIDLKLTVNEEEVLKGTVTANEANLVMDVEDTSMKLNVKEENNVTTVTMGISEDGVVLGISVTYEEITNTETETSEKYGIRVSVKSEEAVVDFTLNADSNLKYLSSVPTTTLKNDNSLNLVTDTTADLQQYLVDAMTKGQAMLQTAQENSIIVKALVSSMQSTTEDVQQNEQQVIDSTATQAVQAFNTTFTKYIGVQNASVARMLLQTVSSNNQINTRKVSVTIVENGQLVTNTADVTAIQDIISSMDTTSQYTITAAAVDEEGYITRIEVKKN